jgi:hypothetical protein
MIPDYQGIRDAEHIKLLSIFHYVYAGLLAIGTLWPLIYVAMGLMFVSLPMSATSGPPPPTVGISPATPASPATAPPSTGGSSSAPASPSAGSLSHGSTSTSSPAEVKMFGWMFFGIGVVMALGFLVMATMNFLCGRFMSARRHRVFILVISGLNAMVFPIGTALGVFTFIVMLRPSVEGLFDGKVEPIGLSK